MTDPIENQSPQQTLENLTALLDAERQARASVEAELADRDAAMAQITSASEETKKSLAETIAAYKSLVTKANPLIPLELISGDSFKAIDSSLESAKNLVARVRTVVEADIASGRVPAGAPPRTTPDVENLSPREKIQYAVNKGGKN